MEPKEIAKLITEDPDISEAWTKDGWVDDDKDEWEGHGRAPQRPEYRTINYKGDLISVPIKLADEWESAPQGYFKPTDPIVKKLDKILIRYRWRKIKNRKSKLAPPDEVLTIMREEFSSKIPEVKIFCEYDQQIPDSANTAVIFHICFVPKNLFYEAKNIAYDVLDEAGMGMTDAIVFTHSVEATKKHFPGRWLDEV